MSKESRSRELQLDTILAAVTLALGGKSAAKDDLLHRFTKRYLGNTSSNDSAVKSSELIIADIVQAWHFVQFQLEKEYKKR